MPRKEDRNPFAGQSADTWMAPGPDYVAPSSSIFFAPGIHKVPSMRYLPAKAVTDRLMEHYWKAVHIIARTLHRPSFERQYQRFWQEHYAGIEPRVSFQAVLFAALLSSAASMSEDRVRNEFGRERSELVDSFRTGTEITLARAHFLRTTKLETLQAFVMYLVSVPVGFLFSCQKHLVAQPPMAGFIRNFAIFLLYHAPRTGEHLLVGVYDTIQGLCGSDLFVSQFPYPSEQSMVDFHL